MVREVEECKNRPGSLARISGKDNAVYFFDSFSNLADNSLCLHGVVTEARMVEIISYVGSNHETTGKLCDERETDKFSYLIKCFLPFAEWREFSAVFCLLFSVCDNMKGGIDEGPGILVGYRQS